MFFSKQRMPSTWHHPAMSATFKSQNFFFWLKKKRSLILLKFFPYLLFFPLTKFWSSYIAWQSHTSKRHVATCTKTPPTTVYCDNTSAINISKNLVQHSQTKHIKIQHHFIRELVEDGILTLEFIHTNDQKADLFTKHLDSKHFEFLHQNIGVISMEWFPSLLLPHALASSFMLCSA